MRKQFTIFLILVLIIASIFIVFVIFKYNELKVVNQDLLKKVKILNDEKKVDYFNKKIECEKFSDVIKEELDRYNNGTFKGLFYKSFDMVFYSPKENSCLYVVQHTNDREYFIYNVLTKSKITSFRFPEQFEDYKKFILDYSNGEIRL